MKITHLIFLFSLCFSSSLFATKQPRIALVMGNDSYQNAPLKNPSSDAKMLAKQLKKLGFQVDLKINKNHEDMLQAILNFGTKLSANKGIGFFFYAGHGIQSKGHNYLIPVGSRIQRENRLRFDAIDVEEILSEMENAGNPLNILVLDACRDNPLTRSSRSGKRGMVRLENVPKDVLIAYSTAPGEVAEDGNSNHSPYATALVNTLKQKNLSLEQVFKNTAKQVRQNTRNKQIPWTSGSVITDFYFNGNEPRRHFNNNKEDYYWASVSKADQCNMYQAYLADYPRGNYQRLAKLKIQRLCQQRIGQYIIYENNTVKDTKTGLIWKRCPEGLSGSSCSQGEAKEYTWQEAMNNARKVRFTGLSDWRVPTFNELDSLIYCRNDVRKKGGYGYNICRIKGKGYQRPTINQVAFPHTESSFYWSASSDATNSSNADTVYFDSGMTLTHDKLDNGRVRLVRGRQSR